VSLIPTLESDRDCGECEDTCKWSGTDDQEPGWGKELRLSWNASKNCVLASAPTLDLTIFNAPPG
jgi:hypothetical protein